MSDLIEVLRKSLEKENPTRGEMELEREVMKAVLDDLPVKSQPSTEDPVPGILRSIGDLP